MNVLNVGVRAGVRRLLELVRPNLDGRRAPEARVARGEEPGRGVGGEGGSGVGQLRLGRRVDVVRGRDGVVSFPVPEAVLPAEREFPWGACLPARAGGWGWRVQQRVKRWMDVVLAAAGLVVLWPVFLVAALLVKLSSPGPVIYRWPAVGLRGRVFISYKFRTMVANADALKPALLPYNEMRGPVFKIRDDPRVTRMGRWLRRFSIDELPQLWSVVKGDMSLVGPRPPFPEEFAQFEGWQRAKLAVKPGITCLWQVRGRNEIRDFDEWAAMDLEYIRNWSLWLDLKILLKTIPAVLGGRGAW